MGLCSTHYAHLRRSGHPAFERPRVSEGWINAKGYREIQVDRKRWLEHRWVMTQALGRPLRKNENVHHINGVRHDNRPENLELWVKRQPCGQRVPDLVAWAEEILALYGSEVSVVSGGTAGASFARVPA